MSTEHFQCHGSYISVRFMWLKVVFQELATVCNGRTHSHMNIPIHTFTVNVDTIKLISVSLKINHVDRTMHGAAVAKLRFMSWKVMLLTLYLESGTLVDKG